ncbi:MAG TPA: GntR family transcriptional regulator [Streptosporangiaceae bacterium]
MDVPEINPRAAEPPYWQIAAWLRARIEAGEFRAGLDPLPSEKDLVGLFGVARDTARRAVHVLRDAPPPASGTGMAPHPATS